MKPCRHQPTSDEWDEWSESWDASESDGDWSEHFAADGMWVVAIGCLDCRVMYYVDHEHDACGDLPPCPSCSGDRWHCYSLPISRRDEKFAEAGLPTAAFGTVELDFTEAQ